MARSDSNRPADSLYGSLLNTKFLNRVVHLKMLGHPFWGQLARDSVVITKETSSPQSG